MTSPNRGRDAMSAPRYMDIATFMRTPLIDDPADVDIALIGVPYDGAVTNRAGARHGPREVRNASSMMRPIHPTTRQNPYDVCRVGDCGDVPFTRVYEPESAHADIEGFVSTFKAADTKTVAVGGDHSVTLPILRGLVTEGPVGLIHIDAHTDTWNEFMGSKYNHGTPFRRAVEEGLIDPARTIQIGIRGAQGSTEGWDDSAESGLRGVFMDEVSRGGVAAVAEEAIRVINGMPAYLSFDIDSVDPAFAPGTGTPEVGGLTSVESLTLLRALRGVELIGADVVEVAPPFDSAGITSLLAATIMYELICLLADSHQQSVRPSG